MTDIVERLRDTVTMLAVTPMTLSLEDWDQHANAIQDGAREIVMLRADNYRLRAALEPLACTCPAKHANECSRSEVNCLFWNARAALGEKK